VEYSTVPIKWTVEIFSQENFENFSKFLMEAGMQKLVSYGNPNN
jgi:hypothetical protein